MCVCVLSASTLVCVCECVCAFSITGARTSLARRSRTNSRVECAESNRRRVVLCCWSPSWVAALSLCAKTPHNKCLLYCLSAYSVRDSQNNIIIEWSARVMYMEWVKRNCKIANVVQSGLSVKGKSCNIPTSVSLLVHMNIIILLFLWQHRAINQFRMLSSKSVYLIFFEQPVYTVGFN